MACSAGEEDLLGDGPVERFLREAGAAARSVEDVERVEANVAASLGGVAGEYERRARFLEAKYNEMVRVVHRLEESTLLHGELKGLSIHASASNVNHPF